MARSSAAVPASHVTPEQPEVLGAGAGQVCDDLGAVRLPALRCVGGVRRVLHGRDVEPLLGDLGLTDRQRLLSRHVSRRHVARGRVTASRVARRSRDGVDRSRRTCEGSAGHRGVGERHATEAAGCLRRFAGGRPQTPDMPQRPHATAPTSGLGALLELTAGVAAAPGVEVRADVGPADAVVSLFPHVTSPAGHLAAMAGRPVLGWLHPVGGAMDGDSPTHWTPVEGGTAFDASLLLLGLSSGSLGGVPRRRGLLVGRLARDAWIAEVRGVAPDLRCFDIRVRLPSLGPRVVRRVRLYNLDGRLLDAAEEVRLVERIEVRFGVQGEPLEALHVGNNAIPNLVERLEAQTWSEGAFQQMLEGGAKGRVVASREKVRQQLRRLLREARGELLVMDRYFGDPADWDVLEDVRVPIRVLTGSRGALPADAAPGSPSLRVGRVSRPAPFHDRGYIWDGGGVSVGASVNGLTRDELTVIGPLEPIVQREFAARFEVWWATAPVEHRP